MLIPIGQPIKLPLTLVRGSPSLVMRPAVLTLFDGVEYRIDAGAGEPELHAGDLVVLDFGASGPSRCRAQIEAVDGTILRVRPTEALQRRDRRDFPRVAVEMPLTYRRLLGAGGATLDLQRLLKRAHLTEAQEPGFRHPDSYVDLSGTGIRFLDTEPCEVGDLLLLRVELGAPRKSHAIIAEVVRLDDEIEGEWEIAASFVELTTETFDALLDRVKDRQEALLGILSREVEEDGGDEG